MAIPGQMHFISRDNMLLNFFDKIYVVNLKHRIDRRVEMEDELNAHGIPFVLFEATYDDNGIKGLVETMKRLFADALAKGYRNIIVLEDDAHFLVKNPVAFLAEVLPQIPKDYHLFYLGLNLIAKPIRVSENVLKVIDCYSTHAVAYSREGMQITAERLEQVPLMPYDIFIRQEVLGRGASYCTFPMMATQRENYSDIEKSIPKWGQLMATTFAMHTKNLQIMAQEIAYCIHGHEIEGRTPYVDEYKFETQNHELIGKTCDCGRFIYSEGKCPTCSGEKWRVIWTEK